MGTQGEFFGVSVYGAIFCYYKAGFMSESGTPNGSPLEIRELSQITKGRCFRDIFAILFFICYQTHVFFLRNVTQITGKLSLRFRELLLS